MRTEAGGLATEDVTVIVQALGAEGRHEALIRAAGALLDETDHAELDCEELDAWTLVEGSVRLPFPYEPAMDAWADRCALALQQANGAACELEISLALPGRPHHIYRYGLEN